MRGKEKVGGGGQGQERMRCRGWEHVGADTGPSAVA